MREYELTYIVHPQTTPEGLETLNGEVKTLVESTGGIVREVKNWGLRTLAYSIKRLREGHYVSLQLGLEPTGVRELERELKIKEQIIRYLLVSSGDDQT
jgi:small subunit ribosomal protein S6